MIGLSLALILGCPKDRTGLSETTTMVKNANEVEMLMLKVDEIERRISQIEEVTRSRGQQDIMKMENFEEVRIEIANIRGEMEKMEFHFEELETQSISQSTDTTFRLTWLEDRTDSLENTLGLATPEPQDPTSKNSPEDVSTPKEVSKPPLLQDIEQTEMDNSSVEKENKPAEQPSESPESQTTALENEKAEEKKEPPMSAPDLLKLAESHLLKGREEAAEAVLTRILKEYPGSKNEIEVYYRLAEASFNQKEFKAAAQRFQDVIDKNPKSQWAAWALLRQGECFEEMDQPENAKIFYQDVINGYPKSKAAREAKEKLQ
jgi:tol-pal system protein YbgF